MVGRNDGIAALTEAVAMSDRADDPIRTADLYRLLANAEWVFGADGQQRAAARRNIATAVEHARRGTGLRASWMLAICLTEMARSADEVAQRARAVAEAAGILLDTRRFA